MVCLDTTFLIDLLRGREEAIALVRHWSEANVRVTVPAPALAEATSGAAFDSSGREQERLDRLSFQLMVLPLTRESARRAGRIDGELSLAGETIGLIDAMIAAVALEHEEVLVTRNLKHFKRIHNLEVQGY